MKKIILSLLLLSSNAVFAEGLTASQQKDIQHIIKLFKSNDQNTITNSIQYPLSREYPIPAIQNPTEMKQRFSQVFDTQLIQQIGHSTPAQWHDMGWRGVMLDGGIVWMEDGKIKAVNHRSAAEQRYKNQIIAKQKNKLHSSLQNFEAPILQFKTARFQVRIDQIAQGKYRYAAWGRQQSQSTKPDLILNGGTMETEGSGGNHHYIFKQGTYQYTVYRNVLGTEASDVRLQVSKRNKIILSEPGDLF